MELTVLGAGGTWPSAGGATSGYLLRHDGFNLLVDAGSGTLSRLQRYVDLADVHGVVISHAHPDHFVDLYPFFYGRFYGGQGTNGVPVYAPNGFFDHAIGLVGDVSGQAMRKAFDMREIEPGDGFELGPFSVQTRPMAHLELPTLGFRIRADGTTLAYTGDTGPSPEVETIAREADLLLSEATWQDGPNLLPFHLSARQAAEHATRAGARRLVLTHIWPSLDMQVSKEQAAAAFDGEVIAASEDLRLEVGS